MLRPNPSGDMPNVHETAFVDPTAILCGKVVVEENVFIGPYAVIRADETNSDGQIEPIVIGRDSNIQDGVVIHSKGGAAVRIGRRTSIAHRAIVHGPCVIGDEAFIGFNSVLYDCHIGDRAVVRFNAVVDGIDLPADFHVASTTRIGPSTDLSKLPRTTPDATAFSEDVVRTNNSLVEGYRSIRNRL